MVNRRHVLSLLPAIASTRLLAQEDARFSARADLVELQVTVRTPTGEIATDLTAADFSIQDNGQRVPLRYFSRSTEPSLLLGLLLDASGSTRDRVREEVKAARTILGQTLRPPRGRAFVVAFSDRVELKQALTDSLPDLEAGLDRVGTNRGGITLSLRGPVESPGARPPIPSFEPRRGVPLPPAPFSQPPTKPQPSTCLFDAVFLSSMDVLGGETGRKAIVLASDGLDSGSRLSLEDAVGSAQRASVSIYAVRFVNDRAREMPSPALERLAAETGGAFYNRGGESVDEIAKKIGEELGNYYSLGFTPAAEGIGQRQVRVTVNRPGFVVHARSGYYASY